MAQQFDLTAVVKVDIDRGSLQRALNNVRNMLAQRKDVRLNITSNASKLLNDINALKNASNSLSGRNIALANSTRRVRTELDILNNSTGATLRYWSIQFRSVATLSGNLFTLHRAYMQVRDAARSYMDMQSKLVSLAQIQGTPISGVKPLERKSRESGKKYGVDSNVLMGSAEKLLQAGVSMPDVQDSIDLFAKLALNSQVGVAGLEDVSKAMVLLMNVFEQDGGRIEKSFEQMIALAKAYAMETKDIISQLSIVGATSKQIGMGFEDMASLLTVMTHSTQLGASQIANALKTIESRISAMPSVQNKMKETFDIDVFDSGGKLRPFMDILRELSVGVEKYGSNTKTVANALNTIAGARQINALNSILQNWNEIEKAVKIANSSLNNLNRDASLAMDTLANRAESTKQSFNELFASIADSSAPTIKSILGITQSLIEQREILTSLTAIGGIALASKLPVGGIGKSAKRLSTINRRGGTAMAMTSAHRNIGIKGGYGLAGAGALIGASSIEPQDTGSAVAQSALSGIGTGLTALQFGINPVVAGFMAVATSAKTLDSALTQASQNKMFAGVSGAGMEVERNMASGAMSPNALASIRRLVDTLSISSAKADKPMSGGRFVFHALTNPIDALTKGEGKLQQETQDENRKAFLDKAKPYRQIIETYKTEYLKENKDMSNYNSWGGGVMKIIEVLDDLTDDLVGRNYSSKLKQALEREIQIREKANRELEAPRATPLKGTQLETVQERISSTLSGTVAKSGNLATQYVSDLGNVGTQALANTTLKKDWNIPMNPATPRVDTNKMIQSQASYLGGTSSVGGLETQLNRLIPLLNTNANQYGAITLQVDKARAALSLLADSSKRSASHLEALATISTGVENKKDYAETMATGSRSEIREMQKGQVLAQKVASGEMNLDQMNKRQREQLFGYTKAASDMDLGFGTGNEIREQALANSSYGKSLGLNTDITNRNQQRQNIVGMGEDSQSAAQAMANATKALMDENNQVLQKQVQSAAQILTAAFSTLPTEISMIGTHTVNVNIQPANLLAQIEPSIRNIIAEQINKTTATQDPTKPPSMANSLGPAPKAK